MHSLFLSLSPLDASPLARGVPRRAIFPLNPLSLALFSSPRTRDAIYQRDPHPRARLSADLSQLYSRQSGRGQGEGRGGLYTEGGEGERGGGTCPLATRRHLFFATPPVIRATGSLARAIFLPLTIGCIFP